MTQEMYVIKRDGSKEVWDSFKIKKTIKWATDGIEGIDPILLEEKFYVTINDGVSTKEIIHTLIDTVDRLIDEKSPNWSLVKGRLINMDLNK